MGHARSRGPFLLWFTCGFEHIDHAINDDDMAIGISAGAGQYTALCGATVNVASMICPPGRRCAPCEAAVLRLKRDSLPRNTTFPTQAGRGRHRGGSASAGSRLFRWLSDFAKMIRWGNAAGSDHTVVARTEPRAEAGTPESSDFDITHRPIPLR